jgi:hypothetical protein
MEGMARRQIVNAQARHKKPTKSAAAKKAVKPAAKPKRQLKSW